MIFLRNLILGICLNLVFLANAKASYIYASGAVKAGFGTAVTNNTTTVPKTNLTVYALDASLGFKFYNIILGANGEYAFWRQLTDPSKVSNVNSQGKLKAIYPLLGFGFGPLRLIGKLPSLISGDYTLEKKNSSGENVKYKKADALILQLHWNSTPLTFWGIEYQKLKFEKVNQGGKDLSLTDAKQLKMTSFSVLYGIFF